MVGVAVVVGVVVGVIMEKNMNLKKGDRWLFRAPNGSTREVEVVCLSTFTGRLSVRVRFDGDKLPHYIDARSFRNPEYMQKLSSGSGEELSFTLNTPVTQC